MTMNAGSVVLTENQAACLQAVRDGRATQTRVALAAGLNLRDTTQALKKLEDLRLVERRSRNQWHATGQATGGDFATVPDRRRRGRDEVRPAGRRLLDVLDRPMSGREIAQRLGTSKQNVHQLLLRLHCLGEVRFGDPERMSHIVARSDDPALLLSREEQRVFSAISSEFATSAVKIGRALNASAENLQEMLALLIDGGLVVTELPDSGNGVLYRVTAAGLQHPQYDRSARRAEPPPLPVRSDRVLAVLSEIRSSGQTRIRDIRTSLGIPQQSINALMQYLKRKSLVEKAGREFSAPYRLTRQGLAALGELVQRRAAGAS